MPVDKNLGRKCRYTGKCPLYKGNGLPENMTLTIWRNVYCYRGMKGWGNCSSFHKYESEHERLEETG